MKRIFAIIALSLCLTNPLAAAQWGPWEVPRHPVAATAKPQNPLQVAVRLFQKYISPVDGPRCPMYPTCSGYSLQALHKHGALLGTFLTVDRLYHEGDPHEQRKPIDKWGVIRFDDPLENNDFWLKQRQ